MARLALDMLEPRSGERVLDLGFGGGGLIGELIGRGCDVVGVDPSEAVLRRGRRRFPEAELHLASAERQPLAASSLAKATSLTSLYFWRDPGAAFAELARVLKPRGRLLLAFEPPGELRKWPGYRYGFRLFEVAEVRSAMEAAGFSAIEEKWGIGRKPDRFCALMGRRGGANG